MAEVFSESLAYPQMKRRSVGARSFRMKLPPSNSTSFTPGQTIQFDLPSNQPGQYIDFSSLYVKIKLSNDATAALTLDRCGAMGLIKRLQISTAGAQIADINNWNVLATAMLDTDASSEWKSGYGAAMLGTEGDALRGVTVAVDTDRVFAIPLVLNPLFNTTPHRLLPLCSLSSIQIRLTLDSVASAFVSGGVPGVTYSDVECVAMITELSPDAQRAVDAATGGKYNILANSFANSTASLPANITQLTQNLGFSYSSMERIIAVHRTNDTLAAQAAYSLGNRTTSGLQQYAYMIASELYPSRYVLVDAAAAESTAEMLIADHALVDFNKGSGFQNGVVAGSLAGTNVGALSGIDPAVAKSGCYTLKDGAGTQAGAAGTASNIGTFLIGTDFENGLSVNRSATIYSGVSTIASNVQWVGTYSNVHEAAQVDFFAQFTVLLSLDMRGSGVYAISV
jgi:hypothetical protein